jgi:hypothetical protein
MLSLAIKPTSNPIYTGHSGLSLLSIAGVRRAWFLKLHRDPLRAIQHADVTKEGSPIPVVPVNPVGPEQSRPVNSLDTKSLPEVNGSVCTKREQNASRMGYGTGQDSTIRE